MTTGDGPPLRWEDDYSPHDPECAAAQLQGLSGFLSPAPKRLLDLGCGDGRVLVPLAREGHEIVGVDRQQHAVTRCRAALDHTGCDAELVTLDFTAVDWGDAIKGTFDAVLCLGNTFMNIWDVDIALRVVRHCARVLKPDGMLILDDFPHDLWTELTEGNWQAGLSVDGAMQMVWEPGDSVFAIRHGEAVDESSWEIEPTDEALRLWSMGALALLAHAGGLSGPEHRPGDGLILMRGSDSVGGD